MDGRIAVHLGRRGLQDRYAESFRESKHVDRAVHTRLGGLNRIMLVMHRRGRARQIENPVHFDVERRRDVVTQELEPLEVEQLVQIAAAARKEVVDAQHFVPLVEQASAKMRAEKAGTAGHEHALGHSTIPG